jgi:hypothetical protein
MNFSFRRLIAVATPAFALAFAIAPTITAGAQAPAAKSPAQKGQSQHKLFKGDSVLNITITTELKALIRQRDSLALNKHPGTMSWSDSGKTWSLPVTLRARGHFRRQARNCDFPPISLNWKGSDAKKGNMFDGLAKVKITTNCRPGNAEYEQYILQEYALYKMYNEVAPESFRTRLVKITYKDTLGKEKPITSWAFFIEDISDVAQRLKLKEMTTQGALFDDVDPTALHTVSVFEYFIGNTDWSLSALHNVAVVQDTVSGKLTPVAFDFDWSGAVDTRYSVPDSRLGIRRTTQRLYRGPCLTADKLKPTLDLFLAKKDVIDGYLAKTPGLSPDKSKTMLKWNADFWRLAADPKAAEREFKSGCQTPGN